MYNMYFTLKMGPFAVLKLDFLEIIIISFFRIL